MGNNCCKKKNQNQDENNKTSQFIDKEEKERKKIEIKEFTKINDTNNFNEQSYNQMLMEKKKKIELGEINKRDSNINVHNKDIKFNINMNNLGNKDDNNINIDINKKKI